jgi:hypothetical protein
VGQTKVSNFGSFVVAVEENVPTGEISVHHRRVRQRHMHKARCGVGKEGEDGAVLLNSPSVGVAGAGSVGTEV